MNGSQTASTRGRRLHEHFAVIRLLLLCSVLCVVLATIALRAAPKLSWRAWSESISREMTDLRFQRGDDPRWSARELDVSDWQPISIHELPSHDGIYWVRWRVTVREGDLAPRRDGVLLKVVASYDLYWDGRLIGRNGRVGLSASDEQPGDVDALFQIPGELLNPGEHVIALRMSSFHTGFPGRSYMLIFQWGYFRSLLVDGVRTAIFSLMAVGAAVVIALVFGLIWLLASRRLPLLLFSVVALCVAVMQALQAWRWLYHYPYSWHHPRVVAIAWAFTAIAVLLPVFALHQFRLGGHAWVYGALATAIAAVWTFYTPAYTAVSLALCGIGLITTLAVSARAAWLGRRGAMFACAGLAISFAASIRFSNEFLDHAFFISAGPAAIGLLMALVLQLRDERREAQQAKLAAARLETELLKKNLQPHFLINTLATIQEVIEQEPKTAVALIDALTGEFRSLAAMSGEKLVPLAQELELCRAHLQVMSLRKGARCALHVTGVDEHALVPPALFLTLIENGLTHLLPRDGRIAFTLRAEHRGDIARYVLLAEGERQAVAERGASRPADAPAKEGTGLRYIKARLEESFTGRWSMTGGPVLEGWETVIEITPADVGSAHRAVRPAGVAVPKERPA